MQVEKNVYISKLIRYRQGNKLGFRVAILGTVRGDQTGKEESFMGDMGRVC